MPEYFFDYITCFGDDKVRFLKNLTRNIAIFRFLGNGKEWAKAKNKNLKEIIESFWRRIHCDNLFLLPSLNLKQHDEIKEHLHNLSSKTTHSKLLQFEAHN